MKHKLYNVLPLSAWLSLNCSPPLSPLLWKTSSRAVCYFIPHLYSYLCHPHLSSWPDFSSFAVFNFQLWVHKRMTNRQIFTDEYMGRKSGVLTRIHQRHCAQLVSPRQHPYITAGVTNGYDTLVPFLTTLSLCLRASLGVTFPRIQWVSLTDVFNLQHFNNVIL